MNIILASKSPRRKELLEQIKLQFDIETCDTDESYDDDLSPDQVVEYLALKKAKAVYETMKGRQGQHLIIGADTVVVDQGKIIGKPRDEKEAYDTLSRLSGHGHHVYTGIALLRCDNGEQYISHSSTMVTMKKLSRQEIDFYIKTKEPMDKAGSYGIQGIGALFVKEIQGDYFNVVGLPIEKLYEGFKTLNIDLEKSMKD